MTRVSGIIAQIAIGRAFLESRLIYLLTLNSRIVADRRNARRTCDVSLVVVAVTTRLADYKIHHETKLNVSRTLTLTAAFSFLQLH